MTVGLLPGWSHRARVPNCSMCGGDAGKTNPLSPISANRQIVDLNIEIDFEGNVEICQSCATEIGDAVGMIRPEQATELKDRTAHAEAENLSLQVERDAARRALDALREDLALRPEPETPPAPAGKGKAAE